MRFVGLVSLTLLAAACGGGLDGDWQLCTNSACSFYDHDALRLRSDDTFVVVDTDQHCESQSRSKNGTYTFDKDLLTIFPFDGRNDTASVSVDGDRAVFDTGSDRLLWERAELGELPACMNERDGGVNISKPSPPVSEPPMMGGGGTPGGGG